MSSFKSFRVERERVTVYEKAVAVGAPEEIAKAAELAHARAEAAQRERENPASVSDARVETALAKAEALREEARKTLQNAEAEAAGMLEQARAEIARLRTEAELDNRRAFEVERERGYTEGMRQAYEENAARKKQEAAELEKMMTDIRRERVEVIESLRGEIIELVIDIAERVMNLKLEESDEAFLNVLNTELSKIKQSESVTISLSTEDYIRYFFGTSDSREVLGDREVRIIENKSFSPGDCIIESESEIVDCGITGQLKRIEQMLLDEEEATATDGADQ